MGMQNEANGTASEPIARYDELPILRTYKVAFDTIVEMGGFWVVGHDKNLYRIEMPDKVKDCMWKNAKRYDIQTGKVMGYTNADRIRGMTDEELAEFLNGTHGDFLPTGEPLSVSGGYRRWLDWLRQECDPNE